MGMKGALLRAGIDSDGKNVDIYGGNLSARNIAHSFGDTWYVNPSRSSDGTGKNWDNAFNDLQSALDAVGSSDVIYCAPGGYTGNYTTQVDANAKRVTIEAINPGRLGLAAWFGPTVTSSPSLTVRARGYSIRGFEFDCPATSYGISILKSANGSTWRPDYLEIANCLFTGGQGGIDFNGGATYVDIHHNWFDGFATGTAGKGAIVATASAFHEAIYCNIEANVFVNNITHIGMGYGARGFNSSVIKHNIFQQTGNSRTATTLLDIRGGGGGNLVVENYFATTRADLANDASTLIFTNATDEGIGNWCEDGRIADASDIGH
jgi:hypothetical protein